MYQFTITFSKALIVFSVYAITFMTTKQALLLLNSLTPMGSHERPSFNGFVVL